MLSNPGQCAPGSTNATSHTHVHQQRRSDLVYSQPPHHGRFVIFVSLFTVCVLFHSGTRSGTTTATSRKMRDLNTAPRIQDSLAVNAACTRIYPGDFGAVARPPSPGLRSCSTGDSELMSLLSPIACDPEPPFALKRVWWRNSRTASHPALWGPPQARTPLSSRLSAGCPLRVARA